MAFEKGHKHSVGNKGGGRKSAYEEFQEAEWHSEKWEIDSDVPSLQAKLKSGKYSVRDVFLAKALQGNEKILGIFANKLLPDLHNLNMNGSLFLNVSGDLKQESDTAIDAYLNPGNTEVGQPDSA